ncbi:hypothetical protein [Brevibacillus daliensis]|uniref:hypothetical protein n=1 Tax=Brevibacillus daliensis TaxID=2892995 RepID=UPI001E2FDA6C|nr:hypothetical protein [Brevibacillus daliensis]
MTHSETAAQVEEMVCVMKQRREHGQDYVPIGSFIQISELLLSYIRRLDGIQRTVESYDPHAERERMKRALRGDRL